MMPLHQKEYYTEDDYYNTTEYERVELMDGQLYAQAAPSRIHQKILNAINNVIYNYIKQNGGSCEVYPAPFAVKLLKDKTTNIVEPDISVICDPSKLTDKGCTGAPDWIIEIISPSTASHDYLKKLHLYEISGVREYWIVDPREGDVFVYFFQDENLKLKSYTFQDKIKVNIYDDLCIDFKTLNF